MTVLKVLVLSVNVLKNTKAQKSMKTIMRPEVTQYYLVVVTFIALEESAASGRFPLRALFFI